MQIILIKKISDMGSYLTQSILQNILDNNFATSGSFSCSELNVGGGASTFQGNVNIAAPSSLNVNNIIKSGIYQQNGIDLKLNLC